MKKSKPSTVQEFKAVGEYEWPAMPTQHIVRRTFDRFSDYFDRNSEQQVVNREELRRASQEQRDDVSSPPDCGPLLRNVDASIEHWQDSAEQASNICLFVMPPCQQTNFLLQWASQHACEVLQAPTRESILSDTQSVPDISGAKILVIPELSHWFMRHRHGLTMVRSLLTVLANTDRQCVVGCNSWAWTYLCKAADADLLLPPAQMFQAFDDLRLRDWFLELATQSDEEHIVFRDIDTGSNVLSLDKKGQLESDFLTTLAARSLGIPWIAWHIWRRSFRTTVENSAEIEVKANVQHDNEETLWLVEYQKFTLSDRQLGPSLLVLHALLLHGTLCVEDLQQVIPGLYEGGSINSLLSMGFVDEANGNLSCAPAAYPAIRQYLADAGYPIDRL